MFRIRAFCDRQARQGGNDGSECCRMIEISRFGCEGALALTLALMILVVNESLIQLERLPYLDFH